MGYMTAYNFTYNSDPIPHLTGISNNVGTSESYTLTTWGEAVVDPFTGTQFGSPALLAQVMVNGLNVATQFTYWYGTGELTGAITPLGGQLAWGYRSYNYASSNRTYREVDERLMSAAIPSGYQSWSINLDSSPTWHATATVVDNGANTQKTWNFSTAADYTAGLAVTYQEKDATGTLLEKDYIWAQNPAGAPFTWGRSLPSSTPIRAMPRRPRPCRRRTNTATSSRPPYPTMPVAVRARAGTSTAICTSNPATTRRGTSSTA